MKSLRPSYHACMRFCLLLTVLIFGIADAQAQFQLLPQNPLPVAPRPAIKKPAIAREAATKGDFPRRLKREEMEPLFFTSKPFAAHGLGRNVNFTVTLFSNGAAERIDLNDNKKEPGTWRWLGDGYCSKWGKSGEGCFSIVKDGEVYKIVRNTRAVAFWTLPDKDAVAGPPPAPFPSAEKEKSKKRQRYHP